MERKEPQTLQEAITYFADPERAFEFAKQLRWPDGIAVCPRCGAAKNSFIKTRRLWFCYGCQKQFTLKVGTIFEDSALGLDKWMTAMWMLVNCKNGVSSHELARSLGITQKSAWFMLQRLRRALQEKTFIKLGGPDGGHVEVDETFIGGKARNMHKSRRQKMMAIGRYAAKTAVMGMLERGGRVRAHVIGQREGKLMQDLIRETVVPGTWVMTDEFANYRGLEGDYTHLVTNHLERYVHGNVHTQGIENFWSLLKRGLGGTYVAVEPFHLFRYVDEQAFRFNTRKDDAGNKIGDATRFKIAMSQVAGKRLTYSDLTGKSDSPHSPEAGAGTEVPF
jgi:transposase-like protein